MTKSEDRLKALDMALSQVRKKHGDDSIMKLGDKPSAKIETFSSGSLAIDIALGRGIPKGRIIEIYGPESSGKTLFCLHAIASIQKGGGNALFIDAEHAFDPDWAKKIGVNTDELFIAQPSNGEQGLDIAEQVIRSGAVDLVVIDSVAALTPKKELEGEMGDATMGVQARMMSQALRKITAAANETKTTVIFINQLRDKIGVMFGSPETTTGGKALKFYASIRIDIRRIGQIKDGTDVVGAETRIKVVKNKTYPPFKQAEFDILYTPGLEGFSREGDIIEKAVEYGFLQKNGAFYKYDGETLGQGKEKTRKALRENPELAAKLEAAVIDKVFPTVTDTDGETSVSLDELPED